ncbi:MAG TPA: c-type cytochrome, methanol metabolism-related [Rhodopseudomonas sp.]|uniref:c-type cytochrome, methanol metabolism-related n=1 Tax=Rhodopseudomonas sp. TaxID=1078 RepID=UPI002ED8E4E5
MAAIGIVACASFALASLVFASPALAEDAAPPSDEAATVGKVSTPPPEPTPIKSTDGKYLDKEGNPTFNVTDDGTVDWFTYSGFRHYHSECHVCHGPYGEGSSYAPALKESVKDMSYGDFLTTVANGRKNVTSSTENVMPAFGHNLNVACHIDDLYVYLRARSTGAIGRVRPANHEGKPVAAALQENSCMDQH